ncbi:MAG: biotin transporter BioY [Armatimonadetes bacterium]|nr:biotin transporter BioY [Armatimonadota bacterium]NIO76818.1 biotin transporter BioY [Armatimonadota bacterium]NIO97188.1 biotin transporter BioY [Armatimonadota bacterium]
MKGATSAFREKTQSPLDLFCQARPEVRGLLLATLFGALTALSAQASIRLPFSPVPITGQVFMVLLAGGLLGPKLGVVSQVEYLALGTAGLPVFAGGTGGPLAFAGPTGGYLIGFVAAAWAVGRIIGQSKGWARIFCANLAGLIIIYLLGAAWLLLHPPVSGNIARALQFGVAPFILVDLVKVFAATQIIRSLRYRIPLACVGDKK